MTDPALEGFNPDYVSPPGASIIDCLQDNGTSIERFAAAADLSWREADDLLRSRIPLTEDHANKIVTALGRTTARFWMNRERNYRKHLARLLKGGEGAPCPLCRHPFTDEGFCSMFCVDVPLRDRAAWLTYDPGYFGIFPCRGCSLPIEGEFDRERLCIPCESAGRLKRRTELLAKMLTPDLDPKLMNPSNRVTWFKYLSELRDEITAELKT